MTETNTDKILKGFREWWLREGHSSRSADSYCSGLRRINREFFLPACHKDMFDELKAAITKGTAVDRDFIAPLLPHLCTKLNYIAAATRLTAMSAAHNLNKH